MTGSLTATLASLPNTRREILTTLKERGGARAEELAAALGITVSAIRQHLSALDAGGLVSHREVKGGPGRPKFVFHLTAAAEALFPQAYDQLIQELLELFEEESPEITERVFERLCDRNLAIARERAQGKSLESRVESTVELFSERGYLPKVERGEHAVRLSLHNCPVYTVAQKHQAICDCELKMLRAMLPDAAVTRTGHMSEGSPACTFDCSLKPAVTRR